MSEKKGPFDATIKELEENVFAVTNFLQGCDENNHFPEFIVSQKKRLLELQLAIHVLKAAGRVDKAHCLDKLDFLRRMAREDRAGFVRYREDGLAIFPTAQIRALLESLPDKEQK